MKFQQLIKESVIHRGNYYPETDCVSFENEKQMDEVEGDFVCVANMKLISLKGSPRIVHGTFDLRENKKLTSLVGGPEIVSGNYNCNNCNLTSLEGSIKKIGRNFNAYNNRNLTSLHNIHKYIHEIGVGNRGQADFEGCPIQSHVLGLLLIKGLTYISLKNQKVGDIIQKALDEDRNVFKCQQELIDAGFAAFAQL